MTFLADIAAALEPLADRPVVEELDGDGRLSGPALLARAAAFRRTLVARGAGPGERVALVAKNGVDWVAADLAALAEGAVLVPFDPRSEPEAVAALVADAEPVLVLVGEAGLAPPGVAAPVVTLAEAGAEAAAWTAPVQVAPADPATIIYTSGSTGRPKGAVLSRGNLGFMLERTRARLASLSGLPVGAERALHYLPLCYAGSRVLLHSCLLRGARVGLLADPRRLGDVLQAAAPHYFLNVPLVLERFRRAAADAIAARGAGPARLLAAAEAAWARHEEGRAGLTDRLVLAAARRLLLGKVRARFGPDLRGVICGSAPLAPETQRFFRMLGVEVYQGYGLTETTALCTLDLEGQVRPGWVGPALPGVDLRRSEEGELLTRGPHVFAGYWRQPEATAEVLDDEGWFRTGDLGCVDERGRWRITGRRSAVLVLQTGHNVPPEPLEEALRLTLGGDPQVLVVGHGRPYLAAVVAGEGLTRGAVEAALERQNAEAAPHRRVRAFHLAPEPFTAENGLLTTNLKLRRREIAARYAREIDALYAGGPTVPALPAGGGAA